MFSRGNYENANGVEREIALSMSCLGGNKSNHNQFDKQNQLSNKSKHLRMQVATRVPPSRFISELSILNSFLQVNGFLNRFFLLLLLRNSNQDYFVIFTVAAPNLAKVFEIWQNITKILCNITWGKRVYSLKKELSIHHSREKELKESIHQLPTPESMAL